LVLISSTTRSHEKAVEQSAAFSFDLLVRSPNTNGIAEVLGDTSGVVLA
jgi:hypothetical protein